MVLLKIRNTPTAIKVSRSVRDDRAEQRHGRTVRSNQMPDYFSERARENEQFYDDTYLIALRSFGYLRRIARLSPTRPRNFGIRKISDELYLSKFYLPSISSADALGEGNS